MDLSKALYVLFEFYIIAHLPVDFEVQRYCSLKTFRMTQYCTGAFLKLE
jgi:hypothetical protein